jgi:acetyl-CoA acyltransferase
VNVWVIGVGMTRFARWPDKSVKDLAGEAIRLALADAGCTREDIEVAFFANATQGALEGQYMIPGQLALRAAGFERIPIVNVENACASGSSAFHLACTQLLAGEAAVALAVGAEKMFTPDKERSMAALNGAWDVNGVDAVLANLDTLGAGVEPPKDAASSQRSVFMDVYAALAKQHMRRFGRSPPWRRRITGTRPKIRWRSTASPTPSMKFLPRVRSRGR